MKSAIAIALLAHGISWPAALYLTHDLRNNALDVGNTTAEVSIFIPVVMSAVVLLCASIGRFWRIAAGATAFSIPMAVFAGFLYWPCVILMGWSAVQLHEDQRQS